MQIIDIKIKEGIITGLKNIKCLIKDYYEELLRAQVL